MVVVVVEKGMDIGGLYSNCLGIKTGGLWDTMLIG